MITTRLAKRIFILVGLCLLLVAQAVYAIGSCGDDEPELIPVGFKVHACASGPFVVSLNGAQVNGTEQNCRDTFTGRALAELKVDHPYRLVAGTGLCATHIKFDLPEQYKLFVNGQETTVFSEGGTGVGSGDGSWEVVVRKRCVCENDDIGEECGPHLGSVAWSVGLGRLADGRSAERIRVRLAQLSSTSYSPEILGYVPPPQAQGVEVIRSAVGALRQLRVPAGFIDVDARSVHEFELRFYNSNQIGAFGGGVYAVIGSPYLTWVFRNPEPATTRRMEIIRRRGGRSITHSYTFNPANNSWQLVQAGGLRTITQSEQIEPQTNNRIVTAERRDASGVLSSRVRSVYRTGSPSELLIQQVVDPGGLNLTTNYDYYTDPGSLGRVRSVVYPDASWRSYGYTGAAGDIQTLGVAHLSATLGGGGHVKNYAYSAFDGFRNWPFEGFVSRIEDRIDGRSQGRNTVYTREFRTVNGEPAVATTEEITAGFDPLRSSTTRTVYYMTARASLRNRVAEVLHPDQRLTRYSYEAGDYVPNLNPALAGFVPNPAGAAERISVLSTVDGSPNGVVGQSIKDITVRDGAGNLVLEESYILAPNGFERIMWTVHSYDPQGRKTRTVYHTGEEETATWVDGRLVGTSDRNGVELSYSYDDLGRLSAITKLGVVSNSGFDAQLPITTTITYNADDQVIREVTSAGTLSLLSTWEYDLGGRLRVETDPSGLATRYDYSESGRTVTKTLPSGGTEIVRRHIDGKILQISGTAVAPRGYDYWADYSGGMHIAETNGPWWRQTMLNTLGAPTSEAWRDLNNQTIRRRYYYNDKHQLVREATTENDQRRLVADTIHEYDQFGQHVASALDINRNGVIDRAGADRIEESFSTYQKIANDWFRVESDNDYRLMSSAQVSSEQRLERLTGFGAVAGDPIVEEELARDQFGSLTRRWTTLRRAYKRRTTTIDTADSTLDAELVWVNDLLVRTKDLAASGPSSFYYDALGREVRRVDPVSGQLNSSYNSTTGQLQSQSSAAGTTLFEYYPVGSAGAGLLKSKINALGKRSYYGYDASQRRTRVWGEAEMPSEVEFDEMGRKTHLRTYRGGSQWNGASWPTTSTGPADTTTWSYHPESGWLVAKTDPAGRAVRYQYDGLGRLTRLTRARGVAVEYLWDLVSGDLAGQSYSDTTAALSFGYDRSGKLLEVVDGTGRSQFGYDDYGNVQSVGAGSAELGYSYDSFGRRTSVVLRQSGQSIYSAVSGYSSVGLANQYVFDSGATVVNEQRSPTSGQLIGVSYSNGAWIRRGYDSLGRVSEYRNYLSSGRELSFWHQYSALNERLVIMDQSGARWSYLHNPRQEVSEANLFLATAGQEVAQPKHRPGGRAVYQYDNAGNRLQVDAGGNFVGAGLLTSRYTANNLNQYLSRTVPATKDIVGQADGSATVTVNSRLAQKEQGWFHGQVGVDNVGAPVVADVEVVGAKRRVDIVGHDALDSVGGAVFFAASPEQLRYDEDGNLVRDGRFSYSWDAENRLIRVESNPELPAELRIKVEYGYDFLGRRVERRRSAWQPSEVGYGPVDVVRYVYDGERLLAELDGRGNLLASYYWGSDLGADDLASGIGSLLLISLKNRVLVPFYDGSGNVVALSDGQSGDLVAEYSYDAYGVLLGRNGELATENHIGYQTRYRDPDTGMIYFGKRDYSPELGRWLSRDPAEEMGGENLYAYADNDPVDKFDPDGEAAHWHHMLPRQFRSYFSRAGLDVDAAQFGRIMEADFHTGAGGIHAAGWNRVWKKFLTDRDGAPHRSREEILKQLERMKRSSRFGPLLRNGVVAKMGYKAWKDLSKKVRRGIIEQVLSQISKKNAGRVAKHVPILGLYFVAEDIRNKGFQNGILNNMADQVVWLGWGKLASECVWGDWFPDKGGS